MPKSQLESDIEKATNENNIKEDWALFLEIVDQINQLNAEKEAIRIFIRRLNDKDPHVVSHTLTLINACVSNCARNFRLEVCSRVFIDELRQFVMRRKIPKLSDRCATMIESWANENDFKNDPALNLIPTLYFELKRNGVEFLPDESNSNNNKKMSSSTSSSSSSSSRSLNYDPIAKKEEEDLAKAIQLSLKETTATPAMKQNLKQQHQSSQYGSLYDSGNLLGKLSQQYNGKSNGHSERRKVKALYDFEAVEENEITFKAGDILFVIDDSDANWWKGTNSAGNEGLFPSNFVTSDLTTEIEVPSASGSSSKKVTFNEEVNVKSIDKIDDYNQIVQAPKVIDESKINDCIQLLQNADPTGEIQPDTIEMLRLEEECYMMGPLIDQKLQYIDQKHAALEDLNLKLLEAFQMYNNLMKESITKASAMMTVSNQMPGGMMMPPGAQPGLQNMGMPNSYMNMQTNFNQASFQQPQMQQMQFPQQQQQQQNPAMISTAQQPNDPNAVIQNPYLLANQLNNINGSNSITNMNNNMASASQATTNLASQSTSNIMQFQQQQQQPQQQLQQPQQIPASNQFSSAQVAATQQLMSASASSMQPNNFYQYPGMYNQANNPNNLMNNQSLNQSFQ